MKELVVSLPDDTYERLVADATLAHKSPEQWVIEKLSADLKADVQPPVGQRPIWEVIAEIGEQIPDEEWTKVPTDASINYKHFAR